MCRPTLRSLRPVVPVSGGGPRTCGRDRSSSRGGCCSISFWGPGFNTDIVGNCFERARKLDPRIASPKAWEAASEADPLFPLQVPWERLGLTIGGGLEQLLG